MPTKVMPTENCAPRMLNNMTAVDIYRGCAAVNYFPLIIAVASTSEYNSATLTYYIYAHGVNQIMFWSDHS